MSSLLQFLRGFLHLLLVENWPITLVVVLGAAAVYLLLPRPRSYGPLAGAAAGGLALLAAGWLLIYRAGFVPETVLFYAFSAIAIVAGVLLITQPNPARAALSFALVVLSTCGLFLIQAAPFLMAATVIIYAGAIIVTFLFVLMLAQQEGLSDADQRSREPLLASIAGFVLLGALLYVLHLNYDTHRLDALLIRLNEAAEEGSVKAIEDALGGERGKGPARAGEEPRPGNRFFEQIRKEAQFIPGGLDKSMFTREVDNVQHGAWMDAHDQETELVDAMRPELETLAKLVAKVRAASPPDKYGLDDLAQRLNLALKQIWFKDIRDILGGARYFERLMQTVQGLPDSPDRSALLNEAKAVQSLWPKWRDLETRTAKLMQDELAKLSQRLTQMRDSYGSLYPTANVPRSTFSDPGASTENVASLGRALFTDYLLAVELAGTLLLVATIGAIAITSRRGEGPR
jgi:NADH:ubiquinone oxidoreductase subunit 6 (subunit J)